MAIMPGAGRAASWLGRRPKIGAAAVVGGAALYGAGSAIMNPDGPWGEVQETTLGDRNAIRASVKANIQTAMDRSDRWDMPGPMDRYYGSPVDVPRLAAKNRRSSGSSTPVSGDVVFGMYNLR